MKYSILIVMIVGGWIALLSGAYSLTVDMELKSLGITPADPTGSYILMWLGAVISVGSLTVAFCRHQREIREWRRANPV